jgi:16S rRNA (adenine1518-N6/adenine1519-N6)-dimethyltransferase
MSQLLTAGDVRRIARSHGIRPSQRLGQNFVIDPNTIRKIVRLARVEGDDRVLEIGAGLGSLTVGLAEKAGEVVAIEFDRALIPALTEVTHPLGNVRIVEGDAMRVDYSSIFADKPHRFVSNLPYALAVPLMAKLLTEQPGVTSFVAMVQREVGERLVAPPGSRTYGAISVLVAYFCRAELVGRVSPNVFWPRPKVWSVIIKLDRRPPPVSVDIERLMKVVTAAFAQRRKTVRNSLASSLSISPAEVEAGLGRAGVDPGSRAEALGIIDFARIAEEVT